ncbi:MAG TPA: DUF4838 domain-containing protein [Planctomycetota bacterium]|nr:DUF4838 domain-containing protein [Planctomycetota bacterium]
MHTKHLLPALLICLSLSVRAADPLVLTPENTVLLDATTYAGKNLQYFLIKYYVGDEQARPYDPDSGTAPRDKSPHFPLIVSSPKAVIPEGKAVLALGATTYLSAEDRSRLSARTCSVLLRRQDNVVVIAGSPLDAPWTGPFAAISLFLNRCAGIRFYAPDELWVSRPAAKCITIGELDFFRAGTFATSWLTVPSDREKIWRRMNPSSNRMSITAFHSFAGFFPPERFWDTHPEIYELRNGKRVRPQGDAWNPCLSAPVLPEITLDEIRARMKKNPALSYISLATMDTQFHCECEPCKASSEKHGGQYSHLLYAYLNTVARQCQKEFPNLTLTTLAYVNARTPPVGMRIEPNIAVKVVTKSYRWVEPAFAEFERNRIKQYSDLGAKWFIHDWCFSGVAPREYTRQYAAFLQWGAQNGMLGAYIEWAPGAAWYLDGARYWVLTQLLEDPYQDVDQLWKTYCDDMFGPASATLYTLFRHFADKQVYAPHFIELGDLPRREPALYSPEDLAFERSLLEKAAKQAAGNEPVQERLRKIQRYFRAHELFAEAAHPVLLHEKSFSGDGLNTNLLNYYLTLKQDKLAEAIDYYLTQRTLAPDHNTVEIGLGGLSSWIDNHTRGKAKIIQSVRRQAMTSAEPALPAAKRAKAVIERSLQILREHTPADAVSTRVAEFESGLAKVIAIPRINEAPAVDGDLSDKAWETAAPLNDFAERNTLLPSVHQTEAKVLRSGDRIFFAVTCRQRGPIHAVTPPEIGAGSRIWLESGVEFHLAPWGAAGEKKFAQYIVTALGAFRGFELAADQREGVSAAARRDEASGVFVLEVALPLKTARYDFTSDKTLTFTLARNVVTRPGPQPDVIIGWHPLFHTGRVPESRGVGFFD